jgi:hypothetical protein
LRGYWPHSAKSPHMATESTAVVLCARIDALAGALRAAGVPPERSARLLSSAATATIAAVTLDALLDPPPATVAAVEPIAVAEAEPAAAPVQLAA